MRDSARLNGHLDARRHHARSDAIDGAGGPSRAQGSELIQLKKARYNPATRDMTTFHEDYEAAEARVATHDQANRQGVSDIDSGTTGTSQSGGDHTPIPQR